MVLPTTSAKWHPHISISKRRVGLERNNFDENKTLNLQVMKNSSKPLRGEWTSIMYIFLSSPRLFFISFVAIFAAHSNSQGSECGNFFQGPGVSELSTRCSDIWCQQQKSFWCVYSGQTRSWSDTWRVNDKKSLDGSVFLIIQGLTSSNISSNFQKRHVLLQVLFNQVWKVHVKR